MFPVLTIIPGQHREIELILLNKQTSHSILCQHIESIRYEGGKIIRLLPLFKPSGKVLRRFPEYLHDLFLQPPE